MRSFYLVLMLLGGGVALNAAQLADYGEIDLKKVHVRKAADLGQSARIETLDDVKALRIDWDNALAKHFEFSMSGQVKLPEFTEAKFRVMVYIPAESKPRNLNLRITDRDGEVFQFGKAIPAGKTGWNEFVYDVNAIAPKVHPWGGGEKANKKIDFPATLSGFASDFSSKEGTGYIAVGTASIDVAGNNGE